MIKKNIDLGIIIPVYNVEKYLPHCLDSIFNQSLDNSDFEVIVVNDCSKGNCEEIIKKLFKNPKKKFIGVIESDRYKIYKVFFKGLVLKNKKPHNWL